MSEGIVIQPNSKNARPPPNEYRSEWTKTFPTPGECVKPDRRIVVFNDKNFRWVVSVHEVIGPLRCQTSDGWDEFAGIDSKGFYILRVLRRTYKTEMYPAE